MKSGFVEAVQLLLEHGADVNYPNSQRGNQTALHDCINGKIAQAFITGGANIAQTELLGMTPLMHAGHFDRHDVVQVLLRT
ncbi:MAG: ankyrin repeat domain-containing protein [Candidatus Babeliales bacterium]